MTISAPPTPPQRTDSQEVFDAQGNALMSWLPTGVAEMNADIAIVNANAQAVAANTAIVEANANAAIAGTGAQVWVSGTTYAQHDVRYSPATLQSYRRKTAGSGTTDPSADPANWTLLGASPSAAAVISAYQLFGAI